MKKYLLVGLLAFMVGLFGCIAFNNAFAGINGFTMHSRANCGAPWAKFNETVSWWLGHNTMLYTQSDHYHNGNWQHTRYVSWQETWRSAAYDYADTADGNWKVYGQHWRQNTDGDRYLAQTETTTSCNIYDGWWDYK